MFTFLNRSRSIKMILFFTLIILLNSTQITAQPFSMHAMSEVPTAGQPPMVLLIWDDVENIDGFDIYRKTSLSANYPSQALNSSPIQMMTDCNDIQAIIPVDSEEWNDLANVLAADTVLTPYWDRSIDESENPFDPCDISTIQRDTKNWERLQFLARRHYRIAQVIGQAFVDNSVTTGQKYWYELRSISGRTETVLASDVAVVAGVTTALPAPKNIKAEAGDNRVLVTWDSVGTAIGYNVYRKKTSGGAYIKVNDAPAMAVITHGLEGDSLPAPVYGFIDYRRWETSGQATHHLVDGVAVDGPVNGTEYRYKVVAINSLEDEGTMSTASKKVTPTDKTPPALPLDLTVKAVGQTLKIYWTKVTHDEAGHYEEGGINGYNVYRSDKQNDTLGTKVNSSLIPQPTTSTVEIIDSSPVIVSKEGEKEFYYRIRVYDANNNKSALSAAAHGHTDDITPPAYVKGVTADGFETYIKLYWKLNTEKDIGSYVIYRSFCHYGKWNNPLDPDKQSTVDTGPFALITEISHSEAKDSANVDPYNRAYFWDRTINSASPVCYAYWIKARDLSQNLSSDLLYPDEPSEIIVCERLREKTPPPAPIVTALQARNDKIRIEWIAPPCQDIGAFHVWRDTSESGSFNHWVGGLKIKVPPTPPVSLSHPYKPSVPCECDSIPLVANKDMTSGSLLDKKLKPKKIYYYKVTSVDQNGNEMLLADAIPYSTFTFKVKCTTVPSITTPIKKMTTDCGLQIQWTPSFDASKHLGFVVFRGPDQNGLFRQISPVLQENKFLDEAVNTGASYWYKVQAFDPEGRPSVQSDPVKGTY